ncbi:MAG: DUF262 domain-containing protein [Candidatus Rokubacteria bacterium]|nr:DUF262 domain-containing protein [Candidatus Rokubacteria bacterium]
MIGHPLKVRELLDEIERGQVLLPEIQRAYVWKGPQVTKLVDSLYREYPAGQILLWDTVELPITKHLEGVEAPRLPSPGQPKIVLDGQQRVTSLYKALVKGQDGIEVYFNLDAEQFQLYHRRLKADPLWVPLRAVFNNEQPDLEILRGIEAAGGPGLNDPRSQIYLDRLQKLKRVGEYKFPIEIFRSDDYEEVTELFIRVNSAGTRLRAAELVLAQLALRLPGAIVEKFENALDEYEGLGFSLDARFLMRAFIAIGTRQSRFRYLTEFWKKSQDELRGIWERTERAVDSAVNFVRQNARFESSEWLPSLNALIPIAAYFDRQRKIVKDVETGLLRWFYLASLRGRYSVSLETGLDEDLKAFGAADPIAELVKNLGPLGSLEVSADEFDDAGWRNPLFPMTYAVARKRRAKDWFRGIALGTDVVGEEQQIHIHHIFPKALLKEAGVRRKDRDEIANLAFLAARPNRQISKRPPDEYLAEIADQHPDRLEAQCIPKDRSLWKLDRFQDFLVTRRELMAAAVNDLIRNPAL